MGIANLKGSFAKLQRADEHIYAIDDEIRIFALEHAQTLRVDCKREEGWHLVYVDPLSALPDRIILIAGDCLTNIRAALDYLVWQLVLREDKKPDQGTCFPICETPEDFLKNVRKPALRYKRSPLQGLPINGDAWALIEKVQPFHSAEPQYHPLILFNEMARIDKHRTPLNQRTFLDRKKLIESVRWKPGLHPIEREFPVVPLSSEHPTVIARFRFLTDEDPGMDVEGDFSPCPSIGDIKTQVGLGLLNVLVSYVRNVLKDCQTLPRVQA